MMEEHLMGATWSLGIVSEVTEYNVHTRLSAAEANFGRLPRGRKYTVAFDDGSSSATRWAWASRGARTASASRL